MAEHDHTPRHRGEPKSATLEDFDEALMQAQIINDIIAMLAAGQIGEIAQPCGSLFDWLASELKGRLERIEVAGMTLRRA